MKTSAALVCVLAALPGLDASTWAAADSAKTPALSPTMIARPQQRPDIVVLHEVTGPMRTNAYLIYDVPSREAALFDAGGAIESLTSAIDRRGLRLKYIFTTHAHHDHVQGISALRARYPEAKWCVSGMEFADMSRYARWEEVMAPAEVAKLRSSMAENAALAATMTFDYAQLGTPDVFIEDAQVFPLGTVAIHALLSPGHSRGSICFQAGPALFAGDVLFYRKVGRTDLPNSGGPAALEASVRRLYATLPDETTVYPGHGHFTEIGIEKIFNEQVTMATVPR